MNVLDQLGQASLRRGAAHAPAEGNADAGRPPLERAEYELAADIAVEAGPVEVGQALPEQGGEVGHVGDPVRLAGGQRVRRFDQLAIERRLVARLDPEVVHLVLPSPSLRGAKRRSNPVRRGSGLLRAARNDGGQSSRTLPRFSFTEPRCFFESTLFALAARLGLVGLRLAWRTWALAMSSASRARASSRLASCVR